MMRKTLLLMTMGLVASFASRTASAQIWLETDYLFWSRANTSNQQYIPGGAASDDADFDFKSGYRFLLGGGFGEYELEASYADFGKWTGGGSSVLGLPLALDGTGGNPLVFPTGAHGLGFVSGIGLAASSGLEASEAEFLIPNAALHHANSTELRDIQLNFGTHRDRSWVRWGVGYRNLLINDNGGLNIAGTFHALDVDDGAGPGMLGNGPNDGLSNDALIAAGFTNLVGPNGYDAINPFGPTMDSVRMVFAGATENRLDGIQVTGGARTAWNDIVTLEGLLRVGLFHNRINGSVSELLVGGGDDDSVYVRSLQDRTATASFAINPSVRAGVNLTDYVTLTCGYELLFLTGVGLGPEQFSNVQTNVLGAPTYKVDSSGTFLAHGGNIGIEVRW